MDSSQQTRLVVWGIAILTLGILGFAVYRFGGSGMGGPVPAVTEQDHVQGSATAPVTLIEYSDFQCPACAAYHPLIKRLLADFGTSTVRLVARNFPLAMHLNAEEAARAAEAADKQGKYWEMHDLLFERQNFWESETNPDQKFLSYAEILGLNTTTFFADYTSEAVKNRVQNDLRSAESAGINRTPTFFVNGERVIAMPDSYESLKQLIQDAIPTKK